MATASVKCSYCPELTTLRCKRCQGAYYCSQKCQKLDWIDHRPVCNQKLAPLSPPPVPTAKPVIHNAQWRSSSGRKHIQCRLVVSFCVLLERTDVTRFEIRQHTNGFVTYLRMYVDLAVDQEKAYYELLPHEDVSGTYKHRWAGDVFCLADDAKSSPLVRPYAAIVRPDGHNALTDPWVIPFENGGLYRHRPTGRIYRCTTDNRADWALIAEEKVEPGVAHPACARDGCGIPVDPVHWSAHVVDTPAKKAYCSRVCAVRSMSGI